MNAAIIIGVIASSIMSGTSLLYAISAKSSANDRASSIWASKASC